MEQKKTMNLWQMIALVVLLAGVTISMFFPVLNPTGQKMVSSFETFSQNHEEDEKIGGACKAYLKKIEDDSKREDWEASCDSKLDDLEGEDKDEALLFPANGVEFLNKSFILDGGIKKIEEYQDEKEEDLSKYQNSVLSIYNSYNTARVAMGIVYFMPLLLIVLVILSYCLKWNKYIMAIVSAVFSLIGTGISGVIYFMAPKMVSIEDDAIDGIIHKFVWKDGFFDLGSHYKDFSSELLSTLWKAMRGNGFLITAIIFLLVLVMAIVTMAVGNSQQNDVVNGPSNLGGGSYSGGMGGYGDIPNGPGGYGNIPNGPGGYGDIPNGPGGYGDIPNGPGGLNQFVTEQKPKKVVKQEPIPQPPVQQLGRVRCIEGNANVPGYKFPEENKIIVGANPTRCQIVINGAPYVSNIHCSIRYNAQKNTYIVKDHSSNGTFVNGARLPKDQAMEYPAGTILSLADGSNKLRLGD